jgi:hypothetical protein
VDPQANSCFSLRFLVSRRGSPQSHRTNDGSAGPSSGGKWVALYVILKLGSSRQGVSPRAASESRDYQGGSFV